MRTLIIVMVFLYINLFVFSSTLNAGGGPVAIYAFPLRPFDQTKTFIIQVEVWTEERCEEIKPVVAFKESIDGDSIALFTPPDDGTYITFHYNTGQPNFVWKEVCDIYVQAKSGAAIQRVVTASVVVNGKKEERSYSVSFGDDPYSKQLQSFGRINDYDNIPRLDVVGEKYIGDSKREVQLHWQKIAWATKYSIFTKQVTIEGKPLESPYLLTTTEDTKATVTIPAFNQQFVGIIACKDADPCTSSRENMPELWLDQLRTLNKSPEESKIITPMPQLTITTAPPKQFITPSPTKSEDEKTIEELNKKVASLESTFKESQRKQNFLEQRLNDLIGLLKKILPFLN